MAYRILDIDICRNGFEGPGLFGADLDILVLEVPILVGRPLGIDMNLLDGKLAVVKRLAERLGLSGNGERDSLLRLLFFRHLLLVEQVELGRIERKMLLGHLPAKRFDFLHKSLVCSSTVTVFLFVFHM